MVPSMDNEQTKKQTKMEAVKTLKVHWSWCVLLNVCLGSKDAHERSNCAYSLENNYQSPTRY